MNNGGPNIRVERDGAVIRITIARPDRLNAFTGTMRADLRDAIVRAGETDAAVIVLTGSGRAFSAGADVDDLARMLADEDVAGFAENVRTGAEVIRALRSAPQVVIGALNGVAAGAGASLAAACDLRIAAESARIGFTFVRIGLHPDWGATHTLPQLIGEARAARLLFTGEIVDAHEALAIGLVDRVVSTSDLPAAALRWGTELAAPRLARAELKSTLRRASDADLEHRLASELDAQLRSFETAEAAEAIHGFRAARASSLARPSADSADPPA